MNFGKKIIRWIPLGILTGICGGLLGTLFHISIDFVTELREKYLYLILLLPVGGLLITGIYKHCAPEGNIDTKRVFQAAKEDKDLPIVMIPLIFLGTLITHIFGGSAGREGAALQLGGSMAYGIGKGLRLNKDNLKFIVMSGMSSVFAALFGTPLTAAVFSVEVTRNGKFNFRGLLPCVISSLTAFAVSGGLKVNPVRFNITSVSNIKLDIILKVCILAVFCAGVCIVFATALHKTEMVLKKAVPNCYLRAFVGGLAIVLLTVLLKTTDYNGAGMEVIKRAVSGNAKYQAVLLKIIFTAITVASGFKGGEIVPTFFIGATFGCVVGGILGIGGGFGAAIGFVAMFAGMTKCPLASLLLAFEVFGCAGIIFYAVAIIITYLLSGNFGLYGIKILSLKHQKGKSYENQL